jgi:hypothetical protein
VQGFDAGSERYAGDVARWITKWIWQKPLNEHDSETLLGLDDDDDGALVGYGTWAYVSVIGGAQVDRHLEIAWFGVDVKYQGERDDDGYSIAGRLYATVESTALGDERSTADMPLTLVCHTENARGRAFWERRGYRLIPDPKLQIEDDVYYRMVR